MEHQRWRKIKHVVTSVLQKDRREWPSSLIDQCGEDVDLFLVASSLLATAGRSDDFIELSALELLNRHE